MTNREATLPRRFLSLALALFALLLSGCGGTSAGETAAPDTGALVGSWRYTLDMTEAARSAVAADGALGEYLRIDGFAYEIRFDFREDGTYKMTAAMAEGSREKLRTALFNAVTAYAAANEAALTSVEADAATDAVLAEFNALLSDVSEQEGRYACADGRLYVSGSLDAPADTADYENYALSGDALILTGSSSGATEGYPMRFEKIA